MLPLMYHCGIFYGPLEGCDGKSAEDLIACVLTVTLVVPFIYVDHYWLCSVRNSNLIS
jgi:hypothetical protein